MLGSPLEAKKCNAVHEIVLKVICHVVTSEIDGYGAQQLGAALNIIQERICRLDSATCDL